MKRNVIEINRKRVFSYQEVSQLLPLIYRVTEEAQHETKKIINFIDAHGNKSSHEVQELENRLNEIVTRWQMKIEKLGGEPKGLWMADFDNGKGYYCWKFPEQEICYCHGYQDGFTGRILIAQQNRPKHENSDRPNQSEPRGL